VILSKVVWDSIRSNQHTFSLL